MDATPRINVPLLEQFTNRTIRIVGKVVSLRGEVVVIESSGTVTVNDRNPQYSNGHYIEVVGKVNPDLTIKALTSSDWGTDFDMSSYEAVVECTHKYKDLFYES